jgi:phosphate transport system substrate-binding protein
MKKRILAFIVAVLMVAMLVPAAAAATPIKLVIDNKTVSATVAPYVENNTTLVPLRVISETLGADVSWNQTKKQATIQTAAYTVVFTIDSPKYTVNGVYKTLTNPARGINGSTMVPIRAFAESIGATVDYNASTNTATVNYFTNMTGTLKIDGSTTVQPIAQDAADALMKMNSGLSITVSGGGSGTGIKDVAAGTVNIGNSSRELTDAERTSGLLPYAVANDGIALIVNPANPVKNLTKQQAADIFLGKITNWKDVGGDNSPIIVMTRETGSGTRATLEELLMAKASVVSTASPYTSSALIKAAVAGNKYAIGYDSIGFVDSTVKVVALDGITATSTTVINKTYGMSRELYCCTKGSAAGLSAMFIDYIRSNDGQKNIVAKEGYVMLAD